MPQAREDAVIVEVYVGQAFNLRTVELRDQPVAVVYERGKLPGRRSRIADFVGDTEGDALRAAATWFDMGCPSRDELRRMAESGEPIQVPVPE
jgi:hypothetical protein